jgi:hypothetical protein
MRKYLFRCKTCDTVMSIETELEDRYIHKVPPCPCGKSRMLDMATPEYAYGFDKEYRFVGEINLGIEEVENPDHCLCLDCQVSRGGL